MTFLEQAYLIMVLAVTGTFAAVLAYYSVTASGRPDAKLARPHGSSTAPTGLRMAGQH